MRGDLADLCIFCRPSPRNSLPPSPGHPLAGHGEESFSDSREEGPASVFFRATEPTTMMRVSFIFGTRPEAVKLCPLVLAVRGHPAFEAHVCVTGQHRQMLDQVLEAFGVTPDVDLALMRSNQSLGELTGGGVEACERYLAAVKPDLLLVQGDTTTVFCAALAAFYQRVAVGHVEAGLRTWAKHSPFPEEINRVLTTRVADYHFAPTAQARQNLLRENVPAETIFVTGNTVIDALRLAVRKIRDATQNTGQLPDFAAPHIPGLPPELLQASSPRRIVLITGHRRENLGQGFENICRAIAELAVRFPDVSFVYPVHLNPNVREPVFRILVDKPNVHLIEPLGYLPFVALMDRSYLVLTDSGGVQEEAPSLGKPVLVMRDTTERPEAVAMGAVRLVGTRVETIQDEVSRLLLPSSTGGDNADYQAMAQAVNPYGDGHACARIVAVLEEIRGQRSEVRGQKSALRLPTSDLRPRAA